jgi:hypothetical protein
MKIRERVLIFFVLVTLNACRSNSKFTYDEIDNNGIQRVFNTNYEFNNSKILYMPFGNSDLYDNFPSSSYFLLNSDKVFSLGIYPLCELNYQNHEYYIIEDINNSAKYDLLECNILLSPFVDFSINEDEVKKYHYHHFIKLKKKYYSKPLGDTAYLFERYNEDSTRRLAISITKKFNFDFIANVTYRGDEIHLTNIKSKDTFYRAIYSNSKIENRLTNDKTLEKNGYVNLNNINELNYVKR